MSTTPRPTITDNSPARIQTGAFEAEGAASGGVAGSSFRLCGASEASLIQRTRLVATRCAGTFSATAPDDDVPTHAEQATPQLSNGSTASRSSGGARRLGIPRGTRGQCDRARIDANVGPPVGSPVAHLAGSLRTRRGAAARTNGQ